MNLEQKLSEMADEFEYKTNIGRDCYNCNGYSDGLNEGFKAGFRAALELPELHELVKALEYYSDKDNWDHGDVPGHSYIVDSDRGITARQALSTWKAFKGEENV